MARSSNQKRKALVLQQLLLERTDEDHPITMNEILEELDRWDIAAERKSVYADMEELRQFGLDIQSRKGKSPGWFIGNRSFELAELKLLVDAVQASRFLTEKKSAALIGKLEGLTSVHQARQLQRQVYVSGRVKTMNESIYYNVDKLHTAIAGNHTITFRYFEYSIQKEKVFRHEGKRYRVSPYGLIWDNENYYLAGWDEQLEEVRHYRVDKMADINVTSLNRHPSGDWDMAGYAQKHFAMYAGQEVQVCLRCARHLAGVVLDRFGHDVMLIPDGDGRFIVTLPVVVSPQFWGWVFGLGNDVRVTAPDWAVAQYREKMAAVAASYENGEDEL